MAEQQQPTSEQVEMAVAALEAGVEVFVGWHELWNTKLHGRGVGFGERSPIAALAAAGEALGLVPKWVVLPAAAEGGSEP